MMTKRIIAGLSMTLLAASFSACDRSEKKPPTSEQAIYRIGNGAEPEFLDVNKIAGTPAARIVIALFEGLFTPDPKTSEPLPALAKRWTIENENRLFTFYLRQDAKWSDGQPVTAHDFIYAWQRSLTPATGSRFAYYFYYIKNAKKFYEGKIKDFKEVGVKALDDHTIRIETANPSPFLLSMLSHTSFSPAPRWAIEKHGNQWTRPENFVGNGPFTLQSWEAQKKIVLVKNKHYWDHAKVKLDQIVYLPIEKESTALKLYEAGEIDWIAAEPPADLIPQLRKRPDFVESPDLATYYYSFNVKRAPFNDPKVRHALALAIDRDVITQQVANKGLPSYSFVPPHFSSYRAPVIEGSQGSQADRNKRARKLLAEAGYPDGKGFPKVDVIYNTRESHKKIAQAIQQMWKNTLKIDVGLTNQEWKVFIKTRLSLQFDIARNGWVGDYLDPSTFLDLFIDGSTNNNTGWTHPEYDRLIAKASREADHQVRMNALRQAEELLLKELPLIPIYTYTRVAMLKPHIKGWHSNLLNRHNPKFIWLDKAARRK